MPDTIPEINYTLDPSETIPAPVDPSLSIEGMAADAKATGDALAAEEAARTEGLASKVSKSGATMTGGLTFDTTLDLSNPTTSSWEIASVADKNNAKMAMLRVDTNADGRDIFQIGAVRDVDDTRKYSMLRFGLTADGTPFYELTDPAAFRYAINAEGREIPLVSSSVAINDGATTQVFSSGGFENYKFVDLYFEAQGGYTNAVRLYSNYTARKYKLGFFLWNDTDDALRRIALTFTSAGRYMDGVSVRMAYGDTGAFNASSNFLNLVKAIGYAW